MADKLGELKWQILRIFIGKTLLETKMWEYTKKIERAVAKKIHFFNLNDRNSVRNSDPKHFFGSYCKHDVGIYLQRPPSLFDAHDSHRIVESTKTFDSYVNFLQKHCHCSQSLSFFHFCFCFCFLLLRIEDAICFMQINQLG